VSATYTDLELLAEVRSTTSLVADSLVNFMRSVTCYFSHGNALLSSLIC